MLIIVLIDAYQGFYSSCDALYYQEYKYALVYNRVEFLCKKHLYTENKFECG